jgi:hypothetical protein
VTDVLAAPTRTAAEEQAERWFRLAEHLRDHPHLPAIDEVSGRQLLRDQIDRQASALADWVDTMEDPVIKVETAHAHPLDGGVIATGTIAGGSCVIQLSTEVKGLSGFVGLPDPADSLRRVPITVADLRLFDDTHHPLPLSGDLLPDPDCGLDGGVGELG